MYLQYTNWMYLNVLVDWKFITLPQAFADTVGKPSQTLLMYLDVVCSDNVGNTELPVRQVSGVQM